MIPKIVYKFKKEISCFMKSNIKKNVNNLKTI